MSNSPEPSASRGYTRRSVDEYLRGVAVQRAQLEEAIRQATARRDRAIEVQRGIASLEKKVGRQIITSLAETLTSQSVEASPAPTSPGATHWKWERS